MKDTWVHNFSDFITVNLDSALAKVPWDLTGVSLAIVQLHKSHEYAGPPKEENAVRRICWLQLTVEYHAI